jgi:hypothetical protein
VNHHWEEHLFRQHTTGHIASGVLL